MTSAQQPDLVIIQASPVSWDGAPDMCMNPLGNYSTTIHAAVARSRRLWSNAPVTLALPQFARTKEFEAKIADIPDISIVYGSPASPLLRMVTASQNLPSDALIARMDAINCLWHEEIATRLLAMAQKRNLDCAKMPDDYPVGLSLDIYRVQALRRLAKELEGQESGAPFHIHPKFAMFFSPQYKTAWLENIPEIPDAYLRQARKLCESVFDAPRLYVDKGKTIPAGAQLNYHYELGASWLNGNMNLLDAACGPFEGCLMLATSCRHVTGIDLDKETIWKNNQQDLPPNLSFQQGDVLNLPFAAESFDAVTSFETVEHVEGRAFFSELQRVIKPQGLLILSTPQNSLGHIPTNPQHIHEYSLEEITSLAGEFFAIEKIIGIKQGCIWRENDYRGQNTMLILRKRVQ